MVKTAIMTLQSTNASELATDEGNNIQPLV